MTLYKCNNWTCQATVECNGVQYAVCPVCNEGALIPVMQALDNLIDMIDRRNQALFEFKRQVNLAPTAKLLTLPRFDMNTEHWYKMGRDNVN